MITASKCISKFTESPCGEMVELEDRQPIINTPPQLTSHLMRISYKALSCPKEHRNTVTGYAGIPSHYESLKMRGSLKAQQRCMRPRSGKERVCIAYNAMMSIYPGVSEIYTACR
jgi:hypothetical protein